MSYALIGVVAFIASGLTLFSGFGLGTILLPVFAIFFSVETAVALTAFVHFLNNLFKLFMLGGKVDKKVVIAFGLPAIAAALAGAVVLHWLGNLEPLWSYHLGAREFFITPIKLIVTVLILIFTGLELIPAYGKFVIEKKHLFWGGILSGFFGGLSGHQGALRSLFLMKCGLTKESFIATGIVLACLVDAARIPVYSKNFLSQTFTENLSIVLTAVGGAFLGVFLGSRLVKKITLPIVQKIVSGTVIILALLIGSGIV